MIAVLWLGAGCRSQPPSEPVGCPVLPAAPAPEAVRGPIGVSANGRHFVDREGKPFFWLGDTAWPLLAEYPLATAETYLRNRAVKGFTVVQTVIAWSHWGTGFEKATPMANIQREVPWLDSNPVTPNDAYFKHVDQVVQEADRRGLVLAMHPSWGYYVNEAKVLTTRNARTYGRWLGARYKTAPNVMWMMGGDRPAIGFEEVWRELAAGLREGDGGVHLITYHPCYGRSSAHYFHQDSTLSFNAIQTWDEWSSVHPAVLSDALRTPPKPVVHTEGAYENGPEYPTGPITPLLVRRQAWWAFLAGGFHTYGQNQMWRIEKGWEQTFDTPGAFQVARMKQILTSRDWWDLVPDQSLFASGVGSEKTLNAAMRSRSGDYAIVYLASASGRRASKQDRLPARPRHVAESGQGRMPRRGHLRDRKPHWQGRLRPAHPGILGAELLGGRGSPARGSTRRRVVSPDRAAEGMPIG
jgi:Protein of unknown function (DUF4038)